MKTYNEFLIKESMSKIKKAKAVNITYYDLFELLEEYFTNN